MFNTKVGALIVAVVIASVATATMRTSSAQVIPTSGGGFDSPLVEEGTVGSRGGGGVR